MTEMPGSFTMIYDISPEGMGGFINHGLTPVFNHLQSLGIDIAKEDLFNVYMREMGYQVFDYRHFNGDLALFLRGLENIPEVNRFTYLNKCPLELVNNFVKAIRYFAYHQFLSLQTSGALNVAVHYNRTMVFDSMSLHHISILYGD